MKLRRDNGEVRRQAMLVLSDGDDTASLVNFDDVMDVAKQSGIAIYTIALRTDLHRLLARDNGTVVSGDFAMRSLAQETGARAFFPTAATELTGVYGIDRRGTGQSVLDRLHVNESAARWRLSSRGGESHPARNSDTHADRIRRQRYPPARDSLRLSSPLRCPPWPLHRPPAARAPAGE